MKHDPGAFRQLFELTGRTAVVTGGAGILGEVFCAALADHGAQVAVVDVDGARAEEHASRLHAVYGPAAIGVACDVADPAAVVAMADEVEERLGPISILHNNAAAKPRDLRGYFAPMEEARLDIWREVMQVNLDGMFIVAREVGARMATRGTGSIIQTASIYGALAPDFRIYEGSDYLGGPITTPAVYSASKAGVIGLTRHLASYWAEAGVRVNTLVPGGVRSGQNEEFLRRYSARIPLGRMAESTEMAGALLYLASDASSYVTGQELKVDGGLSAW